MEQVNSQSAKAARVTLQNFHSLYLWMFIPLLISQVGIYTYYWPTFTQTTWEIHIHYWLVSFWYLLVIIQPYLITRGQITSHRTVGLYGLVLAGAVVVSGMSILDIPLRILDGLPPGQPSLPVAFFYGTLVIEAVLMMAFMFAIAKAIQHRKVMEDHAWWLICSAFYMIAPALGRGMIVFWREVLPPESFSPIFPLLSTELIYVGCFSVFVVKFGKWRHWATGIAFSLVVVRALRVPIGSSEMIQTLLNNMIKF